MVIGTLLAVTALVIVLPAMARALPRFLAAWRDLRKPLP